MNPPSDGRRRTVTVAVINYQGRPFLEEMLPSLKDQTFRDFEVLFIDNDSADDSIAWVRKHHTWVRLLPQTENLGFCRAANLAAQVSESKFIALLNPDVRLEPGWLGSLVETAEKDPAIGAAASKMRLFDQPDRLNGVGGMMNRLGYTWDRGMFEPDSGQYDDSAEVIFASAGAALFNRNLFLEAGGFDEKFFMYHEDVDLCWRLWLLGYRVVTAPGAVVYHHFGGSTRQAGGMNWREVIGERNNIRSLIKNYESGNLLRALPGLLLLRQSRRRKWAQFKNFWWNLRCLRDTLRKRRWIQRNRRRADADLQRLIVQSRDVPVRL